MKTLLNKVLEACVVLLSILFLGALVPFVIAFFVAISTNYTLTECTTCCPGFWIASILGWFISGFYIDDVVNTDNYQ